MHQSESNWPARKNGTSISDWVSIIWKYIIKDLDVGCRILANETEITARKAFKLLLIPTKSL